MQSSSTVYLIRHGESLANAANTLAKQNGDTDLFDQRYREDLIDPSLTQKGEQQTEKAHEQLKSKPITLVLVSPLRRTLQTAQRIFESHPLKPKFVVVPMLREMSCCSCNLTESISKVMEEFPSFDFSMFDGFSSKELWLLETTIDETLKKELVQEIEEQEIGEDVAKLNKILVKS